MIRIKHKTITRIAGFLVLIIVAFGIKTLYEVWKDSYIGQHPKKTLGVVVDIDQREKLFEQLKRFAVENDFDIQIGQTTPSGDTFSIYMSRKDVVVWGENVLNPLAYDIAFYDKDPANPVAEDVIDGLLIDLKIFMSEVPNIRIFEE